MSLLETAWATALHGLEEVSEEIEHEYKAEVRSKIKHKFLSSGQAERSIHIEKINDTTIRIGSDHPHLYWFEEGNSQQYSYFGGKRNQLAPNYKGGGEGSRALRFRDGSVHTYASTYEGRHCNRIVAARHR